MKSYYILLLAWGISSFVVRVAKGGVGQDKADFCSSQKCRYVFVCTSFFGEIICLRAAAEERLSGLFDAANGRLPTFVRETL